jgi:hypothetical protein
MGGKKNSKGGVGLEVVLSPILMYCVGTPTGCLGWCLSTLSPYTPTDAALLVRIMGVKSGRR